MYGLAYATAGYGAITAAVPTVDPIPHVAVELDVSGSLTGEPKWVDLGADLVSAQTKRGKQHELDKSQTGRGTVRLRNEHRHYDPFYTSPYNGSIKPNRRMRIRATQAGVTYTRLYGYVDSWDQLYETSGRSEAVVQLSDGFKLLQKARLASSSYATEVLADAPFAWWRLGDPVGNTSRDSIQGLTGTVLGTGGAFGAAGLIKNEDDDAYQQTGASADPGIRCQNPAASVTGSQVTVEMVVLAPSDPGTAPVLYIQSSATSSIRIGLFTTSEIAFTVQNPGGAAATYGGTFVKVRDGKAHHIACTFDGTTMLVYVDGVLDGAGTAAAAGFVATAGQNMVIGNDTSVGTAFGSPFIGTIDEVAIYNKALSASRVAAHASAALTAWAGDYPGSRATRVLDAILWPAGLRLLDAGSAALQSASLGGAALEHLQKVSESEFGELFMTRDGEVRLVGRTSFINQTVKATLGDGTGEINYTKFVPDYSDSLIRNPVVINNQGGVAQTAQDAALITNDYGINTFSRTDLLYEDGNISRDAADFLLAEYKNPLYRVTSVTVQPQTNPTGWAPPVLALELLDFVNIIRRPQGIGSAISQTSLIQGITETFQPGLWVVSLDVSPAYASGTYFELDMTSGPGLDEMRLYF